LPIPILAGSRKRLCLVNAGEDYTICPGDTVFIGEKISNLPANWYLLDGTEVASNTSGVYVTPTVSTTYVVALAINGVYSTDTVTVTVGCANIEELEKPLFSVYPNPNNGEFIVKGQFEQYQILSLTTIDNKQVYSLPVEGKIEQIVKINDFDSGVYFLSIWDVNLKLLFRNKIIITD